MRGSKWAKSLFDGFSKGLGGYVSPLPSELPHSKEPNALEFEADVVQVGAYLMISYQSEDSLAAYAGKRVRVRVEEVE